MLDVKAMDIKRPSLKSDEEERRNASAPFQQVAVLGEVGDNVGNCTCVTF